MKPHSDRAAKSGEPSGSQLLAPCQIKCPIHEEIQRTNILISLLPRDPQAAASIIIEIGDDLFRKNPFFTVCGYVCGICELECRYAETGGAIRRRLLKRFIADRYRDRLHNLEPLPRGDRDMVAVIGGGPAGLMAGYELSRRGFRPVIFEAGASLGGALRLIPHYRLPMDLLDDTIDAIVRVAGIEIRFDARLGMYGFDLDRLQEQGFRAVFIAVGSPAPRILTFGGKELPGQKSPGVIYGHSFLYELAHGAIPAGYLDNRRVIVIGGGNVALDSARSARRLGADVTIVCLESGVGESPLPADPLEVKAAVEEGVAIIYSRGVCAIHHDTGRLTGITAPRCTRVVDDHGFNPQFDLADSMEIAADLLIISVGQGPERRFLHHEGLLDETGRVAFDPLTLESPNRRSLFVGGDMLKLGFMVDAMRDGVEAAESIDRYCRGGDLRAGREIAYSTPPPPSRHDYRPEPDVQWLPPEHRLDFNLFESGFTLEDAIAEARRCLTCGPCSSCEACIEAGIRLDIPTCEVIEERCSGCGVCASACPFGAASVVMREERLSSVTDRQLCRGCGLCIAACPAAARRLVPAKAPEEKPAGDGRTNVSPPL
ncbi:dihydropyrimidine dehydrogenase [Geobacter sp. OR-1]|uniref:FAD-dependent oxidoreductase n=1 Tax=Geobacter sp. OR-1 TaxID=1266765 RepID=UPI000542C170|nr:FAD-dependent oxidoreductase [Geobacter sp. OR-1]GAM09906.1 dihydropyrimidine dehydrogenase [Geobacter sp. OR-1]